MSLSPEDIITGVILAGGKSSRMGRNKALLRIGNKTFIDKIAETLQHVVSNIVVIADRHEELSFLGRPVYADIYKECGPLAGLHSAFRHTRSEALLAVTCDMPLIDTSSLSALITSAPTHDLVLFSTDGFIQPFPGYYHRRCLPHLEHGLKNGLYSVMNVIRALTETTHLILRSKYDHSLVPFTQINDPSDYHRLRDSILH